MSEVEEEEEKITTEPEVAQEPEEVEEEKEEEIQLNPEAPEPPATRPPAPKKKKPAKKTPQIVEIPVDAPTPADPPPVLERATSSTTAPAPQKPRGRPKGAVGAAKRAQAAKPEAPPPTPRGEPEYSIEDHVAMMVRHSRAMQEARRTAQRDKYKSWVV